MLYQPEKLKFCNLLWLMQTYAETQWQISLSFHVILAELCRILPKNERF